MPLNVHKSARAQSANARVYMAFEESFSVTPTTSASYYRVRRDSLTMGVAETWEPNADMETGRDPSLPTLDRIDGSFNTQVPVDKRIFGAYIAALLGEATVTTAKSHGYFQFHKEQPKDGDTIAIGGATWTFKTGSAGANQTQIKASTDLTVAQLVADLTASTVAAISAATYTAIGWRMLVEAKATGVSGNTITIAADRTVANVSSATLVGGGLKRHLFKSGKVALPSVSFVTEHTDLDSGDHRFPVIYGAVVNQMTFGIDATGKATATFSGPAVNERNLSAAIVGPGGKNLAFERYSQLQGGLLIDDECPCGVIESATLEYSNGLNTERLLGCGFDDDAGAYTEITPGAATASFRAQSRFYSEKLHGQFKTQRDPLKVFWMWFDPVDGMAIKVTLNQVTFPRTPKEHRTGSTIGQNLQGLASGEGVPMLEVEILNDVAAYA